MPAFIILALLSVWFFDLWPLYSGHFRPLSREHDYTVHFYYEDNREEILGVVAGNNSCKLAASEHARHRKIQNTNWTYRCCRMLRGECRRMEM